MNLHWPFRKYDRTELAEMRDRALIAETQLLLLRDIVNHRRAREVRKDAGVYQSRKQATTAALRTACGRGA